MQDSQTLRKYVDSSIIFNLEKKQYNCLLCELVVQDSFEHFSSKAHRNSLARHYYEFQISQQEGIHPKGIQPIQAQKGISGELFNLQEAHNANKSKKSLRTFFDETPTLKAFCLDANASTRKRYSTCIRNYFGFLLQQGKNCLTIESVTEYLHNNFSQTATKALKKLLKQFKIQGEIRQVENSKDLEIAVKDVPSHEEGEISVEPTNKDVLEIEKPAVKDVPDSVLEIAVKDEPDSKDVFEIEKPAVKDVPDSENKIQIIQGKITRKSKEEFEIQRKQIDSLIKDQSQFEVQNEKNATIPKSWPKKMLLKLTNSTIHSLIQQLPLKSP